MKMLVTCTNAKIIRETANSPFHKAIELYPTESNGHKFKVGEKATLTGLEDFAEYNGQEVTISAIREDGPHGKAYYIQGKITDDDLVNWVYEYRLK